MIIRLCLPPCTLIALFILGKLTLPQKILEVSSDCPPPATPHHFSGGGMMPWHIKKKKDVTAETVATLALYWVITWKLLYCGTINPWWWRNGNLLGEDSTGENSSVRKMSKFSGEGVPPVEKTQKTDCIVRGCGLICAELFWSTWIFAFVLFFDEVWEILIVSENWVWWGELSRFQLVVYCYSCGEYL